VFGRVSLVVKAFVVEGTFYQYGEQTFKLWQAEELGGEGGGEGGESVSNIGEQKRRW